MVGAAILRRLARENADVRVLVRESSDHRNLEGYAPEIAIGDLSDRSSLDLALHDREILIHTAADYRLWTPEPEKMIATNVAGTHNIMAAAVAAGTTKIVYTSSVATLGWAGFGQISDETTPSSLDDIVGAYKKSKYLAELEVQKMCDDQGLPAVIVNPSAPLGPGDIKPTPTGRLVVEAAKGKIPAYVNTGLNIVHVDDVAEGHLLALHKGKIGERYVLGGENLSLREILTSITEAAGKRPPNIQIPHNLVLPVAHISELWARLISHREPFTTVDGVKMAKKGMYFSSEKAKSFLGYAPRPAHKAIIDSVQWFTQNGYLS